MKIFRFFIPIVFLLLAFPLTVNAANNIFSSINDEQPLRILVNQEELVMSRPPIYVQDNLLVPVRDIVEILDLKTSWNPIKNTISIADREWENTVELSPAAIVNGYSYVAPEFWKTTFDLEVNYDHDANILNFNSRPIIYQLDYADGVIRFGITNSSKKPIVLNYNTSQKYDFSLEKDGHTFWKWSDDRCFLQVLMNLKLEPEDTLIYEEQLDYQPETGEYILNSYSLAEANRQQPVASKVVNF